MVVGVPLKNPVSSPVPPHRIFPIVCKVPQRDHYWQILLEPDTSVPYGRPARFSGVPPRSWDRVREIEMMPRR